jgi:hypothetical protein
MHNGTRALPPVMSEQRLGVAETWKPKKYRLVGTHAGSL